MLAPDTNRAIDTCLDTGIMRTLLQQVLPAPGCVIDGLRVVAARRSASRHRNPNPLTLRYELQMRNPATGRAEQRQLYGKVYRGGASAVAARDTTALHLPQLDMLLWDWPDDPALPQLRALLNPQQALRWWAEPAHEVHALRYQPERRATLRYSRASSHGSPAAAQLYAKVFNDDRGAALHRRFVHFWENAAHDTLAPRVAQPLGYCAQTRSFWQTQAAGTPLPRVLAAAPPAVLAQRLAYAAATVHGAPHALAGPQPRDTVYWLREIGRRREKIARAAPELAERVARVADSLQLAAGRLPADALTLIHGDFHPDQVWLDGEHVVLFDFDEFTLGDPMEDVAAFVTRLGSAPGGRALARHFVDAYSRIAPQGFCQPRLRWHLALQQLLHTSRAFVFQVNDWRGEVERRLARAEVLCAPGTLRVAA